MNFLCFPLPFTGCSIRSGFKTSSDLAAPCALHMLGAFPPAAQDWNAAQEPMVLSLSVATAAAVPALLL